jgi:hypothetical protein
VECENQEEIDDLKATFDEIDDLKRHERSLLQRILKAREDLATVFFQLDCSMSSFLLFLKR